MLFNGKVLFSMDKEIFLIIIIGNTYIQILLGILGLGSLFLECVYT